MKTIQDYWWFLAVAAVWLTISAIASGQDSGSSSANEFYPPKILYASAEEQSSVPGSLTRTWTIWGLVDIDGSCEGDVSVEVTWFDMAGVPRSTYCYVSWPWGPISEFSGTCVSDRLGRPMFIVSTWSQVWLPTVDTWTIPAGY